MKVKDLIMELIYENPDAEVKCVTYENKNVDAKEFPLNIRTLEDYDYGDYVDIVLDDLELARFNNDLNFENLRKKVIAWGEGKNLIHQEIAEKQFLKFIEEVFEFKTESDLKNYMWDAGIAYADVTEPMALEMGDIFVTLIILCEQIGLNPIKCLDMAYEKIKDRKGKTINGVFIKEEDLKGDLKWQIYKNKKIKQLVQ